MLNVSVLESYPSVDGKNVQKELDKEIKKDRHKIVVLDDDPTGVQTVHGVSVYTDWSYDSIRKGFSEKNRLFYVLTNSRGFTEEQTNRVHREIGETVAKTAGELKMDYIIVSRGDSTLRGHYPLETEVIKETSEQFGDFKVDGEVLCPYFKEGGRFTIGGVHYVKYGDRLIPAGETEFAGDKTFGYISSNLKDYVAEKTKGRYPAAGVAEISLEELRALDYGGIEKKLLAVHDFGKIVVNAIDSCDLKVFCVALYRAMEKGHHFLFRTAAGFVKEFGGINDRPLLQREDMITEDSGTGGIIVVGSHTEKTNRQLEALKAVEEISFIEFNSDLVSDEKKFKEETESVLKQEEELLRKGRTVAVYTRRKLLSLEGDTPETALLRSVKISDAVQSLVGNLRVRPAFVVAKGGITSSDVGTKALRVKRAEVLGQIRPGIPVWKTGEESLFPGIPYVIFPGNVGEENTLKEVLEILMRQVP